MAIVPQISYRDVTQSDALDALIAHEAAKLERYFPRITSCRVVIERRRRRTGSPFQARIVLGLPGEDVFITQEPDVHESLEVDDESGKSRVQKRADVDAALKDPAVAVRNAFKRAKRQLQDHARLGREPSSSY